MDLTSLISSHWYLDALAWTTRSPRATSIVLGLDLDLKLKHLILALVSYLCIVISVWVC